MRGRPERPRSEPEIIPPDRSDPHPGVEDDGLFVFVDQRGRARRMHVARPSPFSLILAFLIAGLVLAGILLLVFGVIVVLVPAIAITAAALIAYFYLRAAWRRLARERR